MLAVTSWPDFWWGVAGSVIATIVCALALAAYHRGIRSAFEALVTAYRLFFVLSTIRLKRFNRDRGDYSKFRPKAKTIDSYILHTKRKLTIISINLVTGIKFHGMCDRVRDLVERPHPVEVYISLLDFREDFLMKAMSPSLDMKSAELARSIESSFASLFAFKTQLSQSGQNHLHICAHKSIPFASVIIMDENEPYGRIQLETKIYKASINESWGFELLKGGKHKMFETLVNCYQHLIRDGDELTLDVEKGIQSRQR